MSVVGPPLSIAVTPDESLAIVTASNKVDPKDPTKQAPNDQVSVIDLKATPPKVLATLKAGQGAAGVSINRAGTLALVSNLVDGTVSVFTIQGKTVTPAGTVEVGGEKAGGGMVAILPDGKSALVSRNNDNKVSVLSIDGSKVEYTKRDMVPGLRPIVMDVAASGAFAVVGHLAGGATGDSDAVRALMDLTAKPPRVVDTVGVLGSTAEGLKIAPDSSVVAVVVHNGSNRPKESPFFNDERKAAHRACVERQDADPRGRGADRPLVAGHHLVAGRQDDPGGQHGREGLLGLRRTARRRGHRRASQDERRARRHPHRGEITMAIATTDRLTDAILQRDQPRTTDLFFQYGPSRRAVGRRGARRGHGGGGALRAGAEPHQRPRRA